MKKNKTKTVAQALLAGFTLAIGSHAIAQQAASDAFHAAYSQNPSGFNRTVLKGKVTEIGERPKSQANSKALQGFAEDLPLVTVLKQITPNGWIVKKSETPHNLLAVEKLVSWEGGKQWYETLGDIAQKYNFDFIVDWQQNSITVSNSQVIITAKEPPKIAVFELAGSQPSTKAVEVTPEASSTESSKTDSATKTEVLTLGGSQASTEVHKTEVAPVVVAAPVAPPAPAPTWHMVKEKSLKQNVEAWATAAGYRLRWEAPNYPGDDRTFVGAFDAKGGPIHQLSIDYGFDELTGEPVVESPLSFQFYQNNTLVVEEAKFEQLYAK